MDHILAEGVNSLSIKAMGEMQHLITFESVEDKQKASESKWLERWFIAIRNVNKHSAALWRETWVNIYGTPLIAWGYRNFHKIGSVFGRVKSILYKNYDCAHVLFIINCLFDINCKIQLQIDEVNYPIFISEKQQVIVQRPSSSKDETESEFVEIPEKQKKSVPGKFPSNQKSCSDDEKAKSMSLEDDDVCNNEKNTKRQVHETPDLSLICVNSEGELNNLGSQRLDPQDIITHPKKPNHHTPEKAAKKGTEFVIESPDGIRWQSPTKIQLTHNETPTKKKHVSRSPIHISPKKSPKPPKSHLSPIQLNNKFGPLLRSNKKNSSFISTMGSSSYSGPLFPPGFEDAIPAHTKIEKGGEK